MGVMRRQAHDGEFEKDLEARQTAKTRDGKAIRARYRLCDARRSEGNTGGCREVRIDAQRFSGRSLEAVAGIAEVQ